MTDPQRTPRTSRSRNGPGPEMDYRFVKKFKMTDRQREGDTQANDEEGPMNKNELANV